MKFIGSKENIENCDIVLVGLPFDGTSSFKSGSRFAPNSVRIYSDVLETYSPVFDKDIENVNFYDYGDICITVNNFQKFSQQVHNTYSELLKQSKRILSVGGEHLVTLPVVSAYKEFFENFKLIHIDAHADLRDNYLDEKFSHATVMRRISEVIKPEGIYQFGMRSGTKDEFVFAKNNTKFQPFHLNDNLNFIDELKGKKVYITIDLDILDPSVFPGTGTPEPGGVSFKELENFLKKLYNLDIIGADVVELLPDNDTSGISSVVAAKVIRELLILINK